jgi:hypothetical protein
MLVGYSLDASEPYAPGGSIPVTLLWRATAAGVQHDLALRLVDANDNAVASHSFVLGNGGVQSSQYLRQEMALALPNDQPDRTLTVELDYAAPDYLACELPLFTPCTVLGSVQVKK